MTLARSTHADNVVLGSGELYVDVYENDAPTGGERYLGDAVGATITATTERTTVFSGTGAVARTLVDAVRSVTRTMGFTLRDSSVPNWALFLIGREALQTIATARVAGANAWAFKAKKGRWFQIGASPANPSGVGPVTDKPAASKTLGAHDAGDLSVIVTSAAAAPASGNTIVRASNYQVDKAAGRLYVEPDAAGLTDGTTYYVHYQPASSGDSALTTMRTIAQAKTDANTRQVTCALRYIEDSAAGDGRNVYVRKCVLVPGGDSALMSRETEQQMAFTAAVQEPDGDWADIVIDDAPLTEF